jgi:hypothetical protein
MRSPVENCSSWCPGNFSTLLFIFGFLRIVIFDGVEYEGSLTFIKLYKAKPVLWDPTYPKYYNKHTKYDVWEELVKAVDFWNNAAGCLFPNFEKALQATNCQ